MMATAQVIRDREPEAVAPEADSFRPVECLRRRARRDAPRKCGGCFQPLAPRLLGRCRRTRTETGETRHYDLVAIALEDDISHPAANRGQSRTQGH